MARFLLRVLPERCQSLRTSLYWGLSLFGAFALIVGCAGSPDVMPSPDAPVVATDAGARADAAPMPNPAPTMGVDAGSSSPAVDAAPDAPTTLEAPDAGPVAVGDAGQAPEAAPTPMPDAAPAAVEAAAPDAGSAPLHARCRAGGGLYVCGPNVHFTVFYFPDSTFRPYNCDSSHPVLVTCPAGSVCMVQQNGSSTTVTGVCE